MDNVQSVMASKDLVSSEKLEALMKLSGFSGLDSLGAEMGITRQSVHETINNPQRKSAKRLHEYLTKRARDKGWVLTRVE
jgi:predicted DNA-binding protein (UPF0251 family)